jgi:uncharacterized protein with NRDE domain
MCIVAWNWQPDSDIPLMVVANRDEFYHRPTLPMHRWSKPNILAGKDLQAGGTWLAAHASGSFAALTNFRNGQYICKLVTSRGELITDFFTSQSSASEFITDLDKSNKNYSPFNLLLYDNKNLCGYQSFNKKTIFFEPGTSVVSNGEFYCNWPKSILLKSLFEEMIKSNFNYNHLFEILKNNRPVSKNIIIDTGLSESIERLLSSIFIQSENYGTRSSTIFLRHKSFSVVYEIIYNSYGTELKSYHKIIF